MHPRLLRLGVSERRWESAPAARSLCLRPALAQNLQAGSIEEQREEMGEQRHSRSVPAVAEL